MRDAVIVDAVRAPIGRRKGTLRQVHPVDLSASVLTALAARNQLDPELIEDIVWGCVTQIAEQSTNVGRLAVLAAGWPESIPGVTLDRACGSSQQAVHFAAASVIAGHYDMVVAGGVESMSRVPLGSARAVGRAVWPPGKANATSVTASARASEPRTSPAAGACPAASSTSSRSSPTARRPPRPTPAPSPASSSPSAARTASSPPTRASGGKPRSRNWRRSSPPSSTTASSTRATARRSPTGARRC